MKTVKKIIFILIGLICIYVILAFIGPKNYRVERSINISAPIDIIYNHTSLYANWGSFSAWAKMDTNAVYSIQNDNQTPGGVMSWEGTIIGKGSLTTTEVETNKKFLYEMKFVEPWYMAMTSYGGFIYEKQEDAVQLTWYDEGDIGFMSRPMMLFMSIEDQVGPSFEQGLADIKKICEKMETKPTIEITEETVESSPILFIKESSNIMPDAISSKMEAAYGELMSLVGIAKLEMASAPIAITVNYSLENMTCEFNPAIPVIKIPEELKLSGRIEKGESYAGKVLKTIHKGSYLNLKTTYDAMLNYIKKNEYTINGNSWEEYIDDPSEVTENERRTIIYFPVL